jgi:hypothetical protein
MAGILASSAAWQRIYSGPEAYVQIDERATH